MLFDNKKCGILVLWFNLDKTISKHEKGYG